MALTEEALQQLERWLEEADPLPYHVTAYYGRVRDIVRATPEGIEGRLADMESWELVEERIWTVGPQADAENWNTDSGYEGYGLPLETARLLAESANALPALLKEIRRWRALLDPTPEQVERLAEAVHAAWMQEKQRQGWADHPYHRLPARIGNPGETAVLAIPCCSRPPEQHHPDMVPWSALPDATKEYDRATVRAVLAAVRAALGEAAPHATPA